MILQTAWNSSLYNINSREPTFYARTWRGAWRGGPWGHDGAWSGVPWDQDECMGLLKFYCGSSCSRLMECLGPGARTGVVSKRCFQTPSPFYVLSSSCGIRTHTHNTKRIVRKFAVSGENSSQSVVQGRPCRYSSIFRRLARRLNKALG